MSINDKQQRGVAWDIIDEALAAYDAWMLDDDYDAQRVLRQNHDSDARASNPLIGDKRTRKNRPVR